MYSHTNYLYAHLSVIWVFISLVAAQLGKYNQNNPLVSAQTVRHSSTYIILYIYLDQYTIFIKENGFENVTCIYKWHGHFVPASMC